MRRSIFSRRTKNMNLLKWNLNGLKAFKCFHSTRHAPCLWSISVEEMIMSRPIVLPFCKGHKLLFSTSPAYKQFWLSRTSVCDHSDIKRRYLESCEEIGGDKCIRKKRDIKNLYVSQLLSCRFCNKYTQKWKHAS